MAVENFVGLAQQIYYNGLSFHRVIEGFPGPDGRRHGYRRWRLHHLERKFLSQRDLRPSAPLCRCRCHGARPDGASGNLSQFYIVQSARDSVDKTLAKTLTEAGVREAVVTAYQAVGGAPYLDNLNTVFGQVYDGMDVVDAIAAVECGEDDRPLEDVIVNSVTIGTYSAAQSSSTPTSGASGSDSAA